MSGPRVFPPDTHRSRSLGIASLMIARPSQRQGAVRPVARPIVRPLDKTIVSGKFAPAVSRTLVVERTDQDRAYMALRRSVRSSIAKESLLLATKPGSVGRSASLVRPTSRGST